MKLSLISVAVTLGCGFACTAPTDDASSVGQAESTGVCGPALSADALKAVIGRVFIDPEVPDAKLQAEALCITQHEAWGGCTLAENINRRRDGTEASRDFGLWQINSMNWPTCVPPGQDPRIYLGDPTNNARCAFKLWKQAGKSWKWWATWPACRALLGETHG